MTDAVYLEDVEQSSKAVTTAGNDKKAITASSPNTSSKKQTTTTTTTVKRQRTLVDMLGGPKDKSPNEDGADSGRTKKAKLTTTEATFTVTKSDTGTSGSSVQKLNSIPFSASEYSESLNEEQRTLLKLECEVMGKSWLKLLKDEIKKPYFLSLKKFLQSEGVRGVDDTPATCKVYPPPKNIYAWSATPLGKVKVVIIGQDPYHGKGQAHGLCFSVPPGEKVPPSLRNIYAELKTEYPDFEIPKHGNLSAWANNGVLMLNTCLTVRASAAGSHSGKGWEDFTDKVVDVVDKYGGANLGGSESTGIGRGVVFLAWGAWAAKRVAKLNKGKHLILTSAHPSPFSANKGFLGNNHFKDANKWLEKKYGKDSIVDWCNLDPKVQPNSNL